MWDRRGAGVGIPTKKHYVQLLVASGTQRCRVCEAPVEEVHEGNQQAQAEDTMAVTKLPLPLETVGNLQVVIKE